MAHNFKYPSTEYDRTFAEDLNSPLTDLVHHSNMNPLRTDPNQYRPENHLPRHSLIHGSQNTPEHNLQDILRNATHFALMAAGNEAHTGLYNNYMRIKYQFEAQKELFSELKEQLKESQRLPQKFSPLQAANEDTNNKPLSWISAERSSIAIPPALQPKDEDDYPEVRFWNKTEWSEFETRATMRNETVDRFGFLCDELRVL